MILYLHYADFYLPLSACAYFSFPPHTQGVEDAVKGLPQLAYILCVLLPAFPSQQAYEIFYRICVYFLHLAPTAACQAIQ